MYDVCSRDLVYHAVASARVAPAPAMFQYQGNGGSRPAHPIWSSKLKIKSSQVK